MKQVIIFLFLALILNNLCAQQNFQIVDYKQIEAETSNPNSKFYYPPLLSRLNDFDTTLSTQAYRYLYYGFSFTPNYSGYYKSNLMEKVQGLLQGRSRPTISETDTIMQWAKNNLIKYPFGFDAISVLALMYKLREDTLGILKTYKRLGNILAVIQSSGDGQTAATAFSVIRVEDEYDFLRIANPDVKIEGQSLIATGPCDVFDIKLPNGQIGKIYFNIQPILKLQYK